MKSTAVRTPLRPQTPNPKPVSKQSNVVTRFGRCQTSDLSTQPFCSLLTPESTLEAVSVGRVTSLRISDPTTDEQQFAVPPAGAMQDVSTNPDCGYHAENKSSSLQPILKVPQ